MPLLLDISAVSECACNDHLEGLFKALAEGEEASIWRPVENPYITAHVEDVTGRLQRLLEAIQNALARFLLGEPLAELAKALDVPWLRWDPAKFDEVRRRLEAKGVENFSLEDWLELCDWIIQRYAGPDVIQTEAQYLTVRAQLAGKIQANMDARAAQPNRAELDSLMLIVPTDFAEVPPKILSPVEASIMRVAQAHAAQAISNLTESARSKMKTIVVEHVQAQILGQKEGQWTAMRQRLFDEFGQLNRDCRRIAVTEAGEACNQGWIAAQRPGTRVRRQEAYRGACPFCKSINGKVVEVVDPAAPDKDGDTQVWLGKTNVGRSASPRMRQGGALVERPSAEQWWIAAGAQHPMCRGSWLPVPDQKALPPGVDPAFAAWLDGELAKVAPPSVQAS